MAPQPTRDSARTILTTAGIGTAALLLAAAAAMPAFADDHGNHNGQTKAHSNNGGDKSSSSASDTSDTSGHNPAGNNGTVKIHDDYGDAAHHNVPHVDCDFAVAFWGFDDGQTMDVSFAGQAPTGKDTPLTVTGAPTSITSTDDAGGGQDPDGELDFRADQLDLASLGAPHPKQGYHVKMTVATYQPGGHKYKVFWLQPCTQEAGTTTSSGTGSESSGTEAPETESPDTSTAGTVVAPTSVGQELGATETSNAGQSSGGATAGQATENAAGIPTNVLGRSITRKAPSAGATAGAASLPFTGAEIGALAAAAALALGGGTALTVVGRRRRQNRSVS